MKSETQFSKKALQEAADAVSFDKLLADREASQGVTIDGAQSRDLDDAIHLQTSSEQVSVQVSIADITLGVRPDSALCDEERQRVATQYLPGMNIPMLPRTFSEDSFSLFEGGPRPAITFSIDLSRKLEITIVESSLICRGLKQKFR